MYTFSLARRSRLRVEIPIDIEGLIQLGNRFVAHEDILPEAEKLPAQLLTAIQEALRAAEGYQREREILEGNRATASTFFYQRLIHLKDILNTDMLPILKFKYRRNLAQLSFWGLNTVQDKQDKTEVTVRKPKNDKDWVTFAQQFLMREESLPPSEQITAEIGLDTFRGYYDLLMEADNDRRNAFERRQLAIENRDVALSQLRDLIHTGIAYHIVINHNFRLSQALEDWGVRVIDPDNPKKTEAPMQV